MKWLSAAFLVLAVACRSAAPVPGMPVNFGVVEEGKIYRGAQPAAADLEALHRLGIQTVLKLNGGADEERAQASRLGIRLIEVPLSARRVGTSNACAEVERAYAAMIDPANWPVYVHCEHGRDRTGFLIGLYRERALGWSFAQVSHELSTYGHDRRMHMVLPAISRSLANGYRVCAVSLAGSL